ncbi:MAG: GTPase HflX [Chlamydiota bacterium]
MTEKNRIGNLRATEPQKVRAFLVGVYLQTSELEICQEHLEELGLLAETCGIEVAEKWPLYLREPNVTTYISKGKLEELQEEVESSEVDILIFDDDITPSQERNLERIFKKPVIDRTEVILEVFAQRAHTREAQLQIELAQVKYQLPRLKRLWGHLHRQRGGGVYLKGEGEKQIEIDRRLLKARIAKLEQDLKEVQKARKTQRQARQRSDIPTFAIVGYTNAGKSTLLQALTDAEVLVEDKLFATLDTTTRHYVLPDNQDILLIDTVGFIRKLPHSLVAAFRSTLEESVCADILLHLIDVSHPMAVEQAEASFDVLRELNADNKPIITVLNKVDQCDDSGRINRLRIKYSKTVQISALQKSGFEELFHKMSEEISKQRRTIKLCIPQSRYSVVSEIIRSGSVIDQDYEGNDVIIEAEVPRSLIHKVEEYLVEE